MHKRAVTGHRGVMVPSAIPALVARRKESGILQLKVRALRDSARRQSISFWALCFYVFVEYVRPQAIYASLESIPLGLLSLAAAVLLAPFDSGRAVKKIVLLEPLLGAFSIVLLASIVFGYAPSWGWDSLQTYVNWVILFVLVVHLVNTKERFFWFFVLFILWSLKMSQHGVRSFAANGFGFRTWGVTGAPGWFQNSGEFAIQMCIMLPMALAWILAMRDRWPRWKTWVTAAVLPATAVIGLVASSSRGGQLGGLAALIFLLLRGRRRAIGLFSLALVVVGGWLLMPEQQQQRFSNMGEDNTAEIRLTVWKEGIRIAKERPLLGVGYEGWVPYCRRYCVRSTLPHNIFVEAAAELGVTGLLLFVGMIMGTFRLNFRTRRDVRKLGDWGRFLGGAAHGLDAALVGYIVSGFFVTVLYYPFFWMNLALTASLHLVAMRYARECRGPPTKNTQHLRRSRHALHPSVRSSLKAGAGS
jgi:O-antigen ligase